MDFCRNVMLRRYRLSKFQKIMFKQYRLSKFQNSCVTDIAYALPIEILAQNSLSEAR